MSEINVEIYNVDEFIQEMESTRVEWNGMECNGM